MLCSLLIIELLLLLQAPMYYRNANCAVVVYDITQAASLEKARNWIRELQRQADPSIVIALCGNKLDLAARRQVTQEEAQKYAEEENLMWTETSAKSGEGVADVFTAIGMFSVFYSLR
jgi:Ras-related protein Rab-5C